MKYIQMKYIQMEKSIDDGERKIQITHVTLKQDKKFRGNTGLRERERETKLRSEFR